MLAHRTARLAAAIAALGAATPAAPQRAGNALRLAGEVAGDQYLAGREVEVAGRVLGDVLAAGAAVRVRGGVEGDLAAVAGEVEVAGRVADDVRAVGGRVHVRGEVGDELLAAGGEVVVHRDARVGGRALLAGRHVAVAGRVGRSVEAAGERVEIDGEVDGDVAVAAERVEIGPRARIGGTLMVTSAEPPAIAEGARIAGPLVLARAPAGAGRAGGALREVATQAGLFLLAWAWLVLAPGLALDASRAVRGSLPRALGFGVAVLFGLPAAALALAVSFVGLPLAAAAAALWVLAALVGWVTAAVALGDGLRERAGRGGDRLAPRLAGVAVALVLLRLAAALPVAGWVAVGLTLAVGAGGVARAAQLAHGRERAARRIG